MGRSYKRALYQWPFFEWQDTMYYPFLSGRKMESTKNSRPLAFLAERREWINAGRKGERERAKEAPIIICRFFLTFSTTHSLLFLSLSLCKRRSQSKPNHLRWFWVPYISLACILCVFSVYYFAYNFHSFRNKQTTLPVQKKKKKFPAKIPLSQISTIIVRYFFPTFHFFFWVFFIRRESCWYHSPIFLLQKRKRRKCPT